MARLHRIFIVAFVGFALAGFAAASVYGEGFEGGQAWMTYSYDAGFGAGPESDDALCHEGWEPYPNQWTTTPTINWQRTVSGGGGNTSSAQFGLGAMVTNTTASAYIAPNTFLSQYAPADGNNPAVLTLTQEVFAWSASPNSGSMTDIVGSYYLPLWANVPVSGDIEFTWTAIFAGYVTSPGGAGMNQVFYESIPDRWTWTGPGYAEHILSSTISLPDLIPSKDSFGNSSYQFDVGFVLTIKVKNDGGQVDFALPEGLQFGMTGTPHAVPEPCAAALLLVGLLSLADYSRRKGITIANWSPLRAPTRNVGRGERQGVKA